MNFFEINKVVQKIYDCAQMWAAPGSPLNKVMEKTTKLFTFQDVEKLKQPK